MGSLIYSNPESKSEFANILLPLGDIFKRPIQSLVILPPSVKFYLIFIATTTLLCAPMLVELIGIWYTSSSYHHCFFAIPITVWLVWRRRQHQPEIKINIISIMIGVTGVILFTALMLAGQEKNINFFQHLAFPYLLISGHIIFFGRERTNYHSLALLFLFFMVPIGDIFLPPLQSLTSFSITYLFDVTGMEIVRQDNLLTTRSGRFFVDEACAGMRFIIAALMIAALFATLQIKSRKIFFIFIGLAVIIAIIANIARAYLMVLIATLSQMKYATGLDHYYFGWVLYFLTFVVILSLGRVLSRQSKQQS